MYLKSIGKKLNVKIIIPHIGAIMNNHNIIKKIIDYIPKKVYVVSHRGENKYFASPRVYTTMDKALDKLATSFMHDDALLGIEFDKNGGYHWQDMVKELFIQFTGKDNDNNNDLIKFWDELCRTVIKECKHEYHTYITSCESCQKTETYLRIHSLMKNYIIKNMNEENEFFWVKDYYIAKYKIDECTLNQ